MTRIHVAVVGAGIVGLATAYYLVKHGAKVTVVDKNPSGDKASFGNAGAIATPEVIPACAPGALWRVFAWMADPLGPLSVRPGYAPRLLPWFVRFAKVSRSQESARISRALAALNARVHGDLTPMLADIGQQHALKREGALFVYRAAGTYQGDAAEWACRRELNIEVQDLTAEEARNMEPALSPEIYGARFTPEWSLIKDPRRLVLAVSAWLQRRRVAFCTNVVHGIRGNGHLGVRLEMEGASLLADRVVVAAGAWSGLLARRLGDRVFLESERGYNMTLRNAGITVQRSLVFPEKKFVATPLECGLRIGGAAEFGGLQAPANYRRSLALVALARQYLPDLQAEDGESWAGHRPATPDSLPVIGPSSHNKHVFYAFGHGHLGLTQAATTGKVISDCIFGNTSSLDLNEYSIARFR